MAAALWLSACGSTTSSPSDGADSGGGSGGNGGPSTNTGNTVTSGGAGGSGGSGGVTTATNGEVGSGGATTSTTTTTIATTTTGEGGALVIPDEEFLATSVAVGFDLACALTPGAEVACWGQSALGTSAQQQFFPELVPGLEGSVAVSSGWDTVCALSEAGTLTCWGEGSHGQLGNERSGDGYREDEPVAVVGLDEVVDFAQSDSACAVREDGSVWCWGVNDRGQLGFDSEACGPYAVELDSIIYVERDCEERPRQVPGVESAVQVSVGSHVCALLADESVVCWGAQDDFGELGRGQIDAADPEVPAPVIGLGAVRKVAVGQYFTCALSTAGEVSCWGNNSQGTLGRGLVAVYSDPTPAPVVGLGSVADLDVHYNSACAVTEGGEVYCWGQTDFLLQVADKPDPTSSIESAPAIIPYVSDAVQVSTQGFVACALNTSSEVVCWGRNGGGATGNGRIEGYGDYSGLPVVWDP